MRKLLVLFLTFIYLAANSCFAVTELYYLKNVNTDRIKTIAEEVLTDEEYKIKNQNPLYGVDSYNPENYAVIILQQSGQNMFYFYDSNKNKRINRQILKSVKENGIVYEESINSNIIDIYKDLSEKTRNESGNNYVFYDENYNNPTQIPTKSVTGSSNSLRGYVAQVSSGTKIPVYLQNSINTATTNLGDEVIAVVTNNVVYNGNVVFPQGSLIYGNLTKARHATYGSRNGRVVIDFTRLVTPDGKNYEISVEKIDFTVTNEGKVGRTAGAVVAGAVVGGLMGLLVGAITLGSLPL